MFVIKRNEKKESVKFDKITARIEKLCYGLDRRFVNAVDVAKKVIEGLYDGVSTTELDNLAAETAASLTVKHPDYALLASRIAVSNLHKNTIKSFSATMELLHDYIDPRIPERALSHVWENAFTIVNSLREGTFGLLVVLFIIFEPDGLAHRWNKIKAYWKLWPFSY